jgi:hypothetical protein
MYHKSRRKRQRFYPEFYSDDEILDVKKDIELKLRDIEPDEILMPELGLEENDDIPANYNDLLYPNKIRTDSVFKQLENMQKDYIKKKLAVSQANNINNINGNEAEDISEKNNELKLEIPDSMYTGEIPAIAKDTENIREMDVTEIPPEISADSEDMESADAEAGFPVLPLEPGADSENIPDDFDGTDDTGEEMLRSVETFEHFENTEHMEEPEATMPEQLEEPVMQTEPEPIKQSEPTQENIVKEDSVERDYTARSPGSHDSKIIPFDKAKAIEYARRWALDRNPNFLDFEELGGDCTNYISQILLAGGCKMDRTPVYGWYYLNGNDKSPSWTGVEPLYNYLIKEKEHGVIAREINEEDAEAGDIVQLSFNGRNFQHTPFIVEVTTGGEFSYDRIKICAHSFDSQNRALDTYQWRKIRFIRILGHL